MNDRPQNWLRVLFNAQPAVYWPWRHSLRLTLITTVPLTIGFLYGNTVAALFVCLGGLLSAISVQTDPYRDRLNRIFMSVPFGMSGFVIGALIADQGLVTIVGVVAVALVSGWISFWGKTFSAGALQMMIMTVVASHAPPSSMSLIMPLLFALGALYAALLLSIEALFLPKQPERKLTSVLFSSLANLARIASEKPKSSPELQAARHKAIEAQINAYSVVSPARTRNDESGLGGQAGSQILTIADQLTVVFATQQGGASDLRQIADSLDLLSKDTLKPKTLSPPAAPSVGDSELSAILLKLWALVSTPLVFTNSSRKSPWRSLTHAFHSLSGAGLRTQFDAQRSNLVNIFSLALCMLIAMLAEFHLPGNRSYWIPLSVAVILKPDYGSVFVRSVQRSVGTMVGVLFAVLIFYLIPKGLWLVVAIGLLSAIIPWASLKNYAWQCAFLTPLILILIDMIMAGPNIDYGSQRLIDTLLGALIVLVFGYFIWPKPVKASFATRYANVLKSIATYIDQRRGENVNSSSIGNSIEARHNIYVEIFGLHKWVQSLLAEPPPASNEAILWLPHIAAVEQFFDRVDDYIVRCEITRTAPEKTVLNAFLEEMNTLYSVQHAQNQHT